MNLANGCELIISKSIEKEDGDKVNMQNSNKMSFIIERKLLANSDKLIEQYVCCILYKAQDI